MRHPLQRSGRAPKVRHHLPVAFPFMGTDALHFKLPGVNTVRRSIAFMLLGMAAAVHPSPESIAGLSNAELDARWARRKRRR